MTSSSAARRKRPASYLIHSVIGLKLSLLLLFVCATGTIAVVSNDLEWLFRPEVRATRSAIPRSWEEQYHAARAAYPYHVINYGSAGEEPYLATSFNATSPSGEARVIWVDPGTGVVTGESSWVSFTSVMRALHYHLFTDRTGSWLFYIICALGAALVLSAITGLMIHRSIWRGFAKLPRRDRGERVFAGGLHRLAGVWSAAFVIVIGGTSIWYFAERAISEIGQIEYERFPSPLEAEQIDSHGPRRMGLDALIAIARREIPELQVREIWFPATPEDPVFIRGQATAWLVRDRTNGVEINPYTGEVIHVDLAENMSTIERWVHTADPLHFGDFAGVWSKLLWVVFGILLCILGWSGVSIHLHRMAEAVRVLRREA